MKHKTEKRLFRIFTISDFEQEEAFLRTQHQQGFELVKVSLPGFYHFASCQPEDMIYRLDFNIVDKNDKQSYRQMFRDAEWEYLGEVMDWSYFRKPASSATNDLHLFSDIESKISFLDRIYKRRMIPLLFIFICALVPQLVNTFSVSMFIGERFTIISIIHLIFLLIFILYLWIFIHCGTRIWKLKKKYLNGE